MNKIKELFCLFVYKLSPIKKKRVVFTSFQGQYTDNPKAVALKFHELHPDYELVWLLKDGQGKDLPSYFKRVNINSVKAYRYWGSAKIHIDNVYGIRATFLIDDSKKSRFKAKLYTFLTYKKKQYIFTNFHGVPIKKIGRDQLGNDIKDMICKGTTLILGDQYSKDIMANVTFNKLPIELLGYPRDDVLFSENTTAKEQVGLPSDRKIALFAPTFRNDGKDVEGKNVQRSGLDQINAFDFDLFFKTLYERFGGDWSLVLRFHYHVAEMVDWASLKKKYGDRIINGNQYPDMADYLSATDLLITDSSSCMIDYSLTYKPCLLFFPDLKNYQNKERGFYVDIKSLPFPVSETFDEFINCIKNFDENKYQQDVKQMHLKIGSVSDAHSSERMINFIFDNYLTKK